MAAALGLVAAAPVMALDINSYKAGTVPAEGSFAEADTCAAVGALYWVSAMREPGYANPTPDDKEYYDALEAMTMFWLNKAAVTSGKSDDAYMEDVKNVLGPISELGQEVNFPHFQRCVDRWKLLR